MVRTAELLTTLRVVRCSLGAEGESSFEEEETCTKSQGVSRYPKMFLPHLGNICPIVYVDIRTAELLTYQ